MRKCTSCDRELKPVILTEDNPNTRQLDQALELNFVGGYGMYIESPCFMDVPPELKPPTWNRYSTMVVFLCHDCVDATRKSVPWLDEAFRKIGV